MGYNTLRKLAIGAAVLGAAGSLGLLLRAAERPSRPVLVVMSVWVVSPFVLFAVAETVRTRWSSSVHATFDTATVILTAAMLIFYAVPGLKPPNTAAAFLFVLLPPVSVVLTVVATILAAIFSPRE
jgi:hypothetical protein